MPVPARPRRKGIARERWGFQEEASSWPSHSNAPWYQEFSEREECWFRRGNLPPALAWKGPKGHGRNVMCGERGQVLEEDTWTRFGYLPEMRLRAAPPHFCRSLLRIRSLPEAIPEALSGDAL